MELAADRPWRAREILGGSLPDLGYDPALYERLGNVLLRMNDLPGAGRFLFLSGARREEYDEAIQIYRDRHSGGGARQLIATFPRRARLSSLSEYPAAVAEVLRAIGCPETRDQAFPPAEALPAASEGPACCFIFGTIARIGLGLMMAGVVKVVELLVEWGW